MFTGIEHFAIASPNPASLARWYSDHLDFTINYEYAGNFFVKAQNGAQIEIIPSDGERGANEPKTPGMRHIAISVENFDLAYQHLRNTGVHFTAEPYTNQGNRLVFFEDGDGNLVHLIERAEPLP